MKTWSRMGLWTAVSVLLTVIIVISAVRARGARRDDGLNDPLPIATRTTAPISREPKPSAAVGIVRHPSKKATASK